MQCHWEVFNGIYIDPMSLNVLFFVLLCFTGIPCDSCIHYVTWGGGQNRPFSGCPVAGCRLQSIILPPDDGRMAGGFCPSRESCKRSNEKPEHPGVPRVRGKWGRRGG